MKRAIGIGLLLLANMVLLVHAVIPHHHHDDLFSCDVSHHQHDADHHCRHLQTADNNSCKHNELSFEDCLLDKIYVRFVEDKYVFQSVDFHPDNNFQLSISCFLPNNSILVKPDCDFLPFRQKPFVESLYINHITQSKGLRAPPFC